jgi:hypothetical protein
MKKQKFHLESLGMWTFCMLTVFAITVAQAQPRMTVNVPFNFQISDRAFPAGQYSVSAARDHLTVQDSAGKVVFIGIANPVSGRRVGKTGQVVFHCYDDRCFLSEYWTPTRENGSQLLPSRYETELAKHRKGTEFALLEQPQS